MKKLDAFQKGDGAHCGLSDWYEDGEAQIVAALAAHEPFDTGWYSSKKEIASARIRSEDGAKIKVDVSVTDDFDTPGSGYASTTTWTVDAVQDCISTAWSKADNDRDDNQEYEGFGIIDHSQTFASWVETYLLPRGWAESLEPSGDNYHWWGWQYDELDGQSVPDPRIPLPAVAAFEWWAANWMNGKNVGDSLRIGDWEIRPWRDTPPVYEDPNDYRGMGWVDDRGRP